MARLFWDLCKPGDSWRKVIFCGIAAAFLTPFALGQTQVSKNRDACVDDITADDGYLIRSVKVSIRYLSLPLPAAGTPYSPEVVTKLTEDVFHILKREQSAREETEFSLLNTVSVGNRSVDGQGGFGLNAVFSCVRKREPEVCRAALGASNSKCVDVVIHPISLRLDTTNVWNNLLNLARSNQPTNFNRVPGLLRAFNPKFGLEYDRRFGAAERAEISTDLLDLRKNLDRASLTPRKMRLNLEAQGRKSQSEPFYNAQSRLSFTRRLTGGAEAVGLEAGFSADHLPLGNGNYLKNAATFGGNATFRPRAGMIGKLTLGGRYRWASQRFFQLGNQLPELTSERAFEGRLISDGQLLGGSLRIALWGEVASPESGHDTYRRGAAMLGYAREIPVALNQTVGVEAIAGGGRIWGKMPGYARFYGGNVAKNFLYEPVDSPLLAHFPIGPLIRSLGQGQAAAAKSAGVVAGGDSYWHFNLNVSVPAPRWSSPLVPDVTIDDIPKKDADGRIMVDVNGDPVLESRPLKELLKGQGETAVKSLRRLFMKEGLSRDEAEAKARRELKGISSGLTFLADEANLYAVKPLFLLDAARISAPGGMHQTRYAAGGGLQITIVIAKFEIGYMQTLRRLPGDDRGNLVVRLIFGNLF